jgi:hypothetical protein
LSTNVPVVPDASRLTVPAGLTQGAAQVRVNVAAPVSGAIGSLNAALMMDTLAATPVALSAGATDVTVGGAAPALPAAAAMFDDDPPSLHPAVNTPSSNANNAVARLRFPLSVCI